MSKKIIDKAKHILKGIEFDLDITFDWSKDYYDNYYQYFSHPDSEVRKYALLIFAGGLGNWYLESARIFRPVEEQKTDRDFDIDKVYHFENYVQSFLDNRENIQHEFPNLYNALIWYLLRLDNKKNFDITFTSVDKQLFDELRQVLTESGIDASIFLNNHKDILNEVGIPSNIFLK